MAGVISKQPNGRYCRISTVSEAPTIWNISKEELDDYLVKTNQKYPFTVDQWLQRYGYEFDEAKKYISTLNMSNEEKNKWLKEVGE